MQVGELPVRVEKPWGYELLWAHTEKYVGKLLHIDRGHSLSRQYHVQKEETLLVLSGTLVLEIGEAPDIVRTEIGKDARFHLPPRTVHRMTAATDCDLVEVSTPELDDVVRLEDRYGRAK